MEIQAIQIIQVIKGQAQLEVNLLKNLLRKPVIQVEVLTLTTLVNGDGDKDSSTSSDENNDVSEKPGKDDGAPDEPTIEDETDDAADEDEEPTKPSDTEDEEKPTPPEESETPGIQTKQKTIK